MDTCGTARKPGEGGKQSSSQRKGGYSHPVIQGSRNAKATEEGERNTGVLAQQDPGHQGSASRGRLMKTRDTEGPRWDRRSCYRSKNKQQTSDVHRCPKVSRWVLAAFIAPREQQNLGASPREQLGPLGLDTLEGHTYVWRQF